MSDNTVSNNQWSHVCVTWDGSVFKMFVNGIEQSQTLSYSSISYGTLETRIGQYGSDYFNGLIDECALFNSSVDAAVIYNDGVPNDIITLNPVGWWRMGENDSATDGGTVTGIQDASGNGNHATTVANSQPTFSTVVPS